MFRKEPTTRHNSLQLAATHYNSLQHTATHCNTLQHTATHCHIFSGGSLRAYHSPPPHRHTAIHCTHIAQHYNTVQHGAHTATHCNTLQHTATHCNTATHFPRCSLPLTKTAVAAANNNPPKKKKTHLTGGAHTPSLTCSIFLVVSVPFCITSGRYFVFAFVIVFLNPLYLYLYLCVFFLQHLG